MITAFQILSIFVLLATFTFRVKSETTSFTESDEEETEEKILKLKHLNESFFWSTEAPPSNETSPKFNLDVILNAKKENAWLENETSFSDYEDLHEEKKSDASPENSVEGDLLENVNYFLPDKPVTDPTFYTDFKPELSSSFKSILLNNDSLSSSIPELNVKISLTRTSCAYGERKCTLELSTEMSSKLNGTTYSMDNSPLVTSEVILSKHAAYVSEETPYFPTSTKMFDNYVTLTPSVQTSDNLILTEDSEISKDDSVTHVQLSKSNKSKQFVKERENINNVTDEILARTFFKTTEATPQVSIDKILVSSVNVPLFASSVLTKLLNLSTSNMNSTPLKSFQPSTIAPYVALKTNNNRLESSNLVKELDSEVNHKRPNEIYSTMSSIFPTVSLYNSKLSIPFDDVKMSKEAKFSETIPLLSPSFSVPLPSPESEIIINKKSTFKHTPLLSDLSIDISLIKHPSIVSSVPKPEFIPTIHSEDTTTTISTIQDEEKVQAVPPPRLSNPSCSSLPVCIEITLLDSSWETFCTQKPEFLQFLSKSVSHYTRPIHPYHIVLDTEICTLTSTRRGPHSSPDVTVAFYITNDAGEYEERMTEICGVILRKWAPSTFKSSVIEVRIYSSESQSTPLPVIPELNSGFVAAVSISAVAGVALCLLCILLVIMKQKLIHGRNSDTTTPTADAYSLDSLSISASFRRRRLRRSARSYLNHAFSDQEFPSHPLTEKNLANCLKSKDLLEEEFKRIPMTMPKLDSIPEGAHVKNRYSNILPKAESRVMLADPSGDPLKCYINANFVKGYEGKPASYIACQAPLPEGIEEFWRMVWEQQSRVIVMLTMFEENGTSRCAVYFPQSTLISQQPYGDFQVSLLKKDVYEFYTLSTLRLLDLEKNLFRDVVHLWFTGWPDVGVPKESSSLVTFVQQCRTYINCNSGPTIVHCSTGTGRTGVFLALDICMREYDETRSIDILQCVSQLRRDRAGAVQNKDQYFLIHEALLEYVSRLANQSQRPSVCN